VRCDRPCPSGRRAGARRRSGVRQSRGGRPRARTAATVDLTMARGGDNLEWAPQPRLGDGFPQLGGKDGEPTGGVEMKIRPTVTFEEIGGLTQAKETLRGFATALTTPERYREWGIAPPKGLLLYGPPGTGKAMLARALASAAEAIFYHLKLMNLTSKFAA